MTDETGAFEWVRPSKLVEYYLAKRFDDLEEADKQLYLAVLRGDVRARLKGLILGPEWLKQVSKMKVSETDPFALPPDLELSVEDAKRIWGV
jgi:hypothetical protein